MTPPEPQPGVMHPVDKAFYDLAIKERDYERAKVDRLEAEVKRLRENRPPSCIECPECGAEVDTRTARAL